MYELTVEGEFSAAHRLREYNGACERLHGHNWRVELTVAGEKLNDLGMAMDFRDLKCALQSVLERFDHAFLNEVADFREQNPTTENIARIVAEECGSKLPGGMRVQGVTVWESPRCRARYRPPRGTEES